MNGNQNTMPDHLNSSKPFVISLFNILRSSFRESPLSFDSLVRKAQKRTNLSDLGGDFNETALKMLISSANEEAKLNSFGKFMFKEKLIGQLEQRLWAEHWFKKSPEILDQEIIPVIMIAGLQRTGTTKLQRLLSLNEDARGLLSWEALYPAPVRNKTERQKRIRRTKMNERAVRWINPRFFDIHPIEHDKPEEDVLLLDLNFMSTSSEAILHVPGYARWLEDQDHMDAYNYEKKLLKLLQWQQGGKYWVLKSPHHLEHFDLIDQVFPQVKFLWTHREPAVCIPSFLSMLFFSRTMFSDEVNRNDIKSHWMKKIKRMLERGLQSRSKLKNRILDITFKDLINSEEQTIQKIENQFGFKVGSMQTPGAKQYKSQHSYNLSDWDLDENIIRVEFKAYYDLLNSIN